MTRLLWIALLSLGCGITAFADSLESRLTRALAAGKSESDRLHRFLSTHWDYVMKEFPETATVLGYPGQNDRWTDQSLAAFARRKVDSRAAQKLFGRIRRAKLNNADRLNYDLYKRELDLDVEGLPFPAEYLAIDQLEGVQQSARTFAAMPTASQKNYTDILIRLKTLPTLIDQTILLLQEGLKQRVTPPRITLRDLPEQVKSQIVDEPEKAPVLTPFANMPGSFSPSIQAQYKREAADVYKRLVSPAYQRLYDFLVKEYIPRTRETTPWSALPQGAAWYAYLARRNTTTDLTPKEIHELGLREVKRIREEMDQIIAKVPFKDGFKAFTEFLRTDDRFYYKKPEELLTGYRDLAKRIDAELPKLFTKFPRLPYGVQPVPSYAEKSAPTAYYEPGSREFGRAGIFFANTYDLRSRPKWGMESLTLHEAVPGHHLQIALSQEMENMPEFRKNAFTTAYVEGWALYCETLGEQLGLYTDPYNKFGSLSDEIFRAIRLVVDTGMHSLGWSREQAIAYFTENSASPAGAITAEIDRYLVLPGQALAYKIGALKIQELRALAAQELGGSFDLRKFHDQVLAQGALPMKVLESEIKTWIQQQKKAKK